MIVLDASAAVDWLLQTPAGRRIERRIFARNETLHAPHLLDLEIAQVLRRLARQETVSQRRADEAIDDLLKLRLTRYPISSCCHESGGCATTAAPTTRPTSRWRRSWMLRCLRAMQEWRGLRGMEHRLSCFEPGAPLLARSLGPQLISD